MECGLRVVESISQSFANSPLAGIAFGCRILTIPSPVVMGPFMDDEFMLLVEICDVPAFPSDAGGGGGGAAVGCSTCCTSPPSARDAAGRDSDGDIGGGSAMEGASVSVSFSHGFFRRGVWSTLLLPSSRTVSGISSIPGMGLLEVMRSTIAANDVG